jgi:hypothetical protein
VPGDSMSLLLDEVCGELNGIQDWINRAEYIMHRAILTPLNNDVDEINKEISTRFLRNTDGSPITIHKYYSGFQCFTVNSQTKFKFGPWYVST